MVDRNHLSLRIGFDLRYLQQAYRNSTDGGIGGPGVYARELWKAMARLFPATELIALVDHGGMPNQLNALIRLAPRNKVLPFGIAGRNTILGRLDNSRYSWMIRALESELSMGVRASTSCFDVLHVLAQVPPPPSTLWPSVVTVYDLITLGAGIPRGKTVVSRLHQRYLGLISRGDRLVCISQSTKSDLVQRLKVDKSKIEIVYPGVDLSTYRPGPRSREEIERRFGISEDYFLHVGVCYGRKNPESLLKAMKFAVSSSQEDFVLVLAGPYQVNENALRVLRQRAHDYGIGNRVIVVGDVSDRELASLYRNAQALVFPSLYEGFGFPAAECLACGTPCVVSNTSSLPEVVGGLGILVAPTDARQIARAMLSIVRSGRMQRIETEGPRWASRFSWDRAAAAYWHIYKELVGEKGRTRERG